jgi:hypothetical protein
LPKKTSQDNKGFFVVFIILVFLWIVFAVFGLQAGQHGEFVNWVKQNGTDDWYSYPIMKYIGTIGYAVIGDPFFLVFPFLLFSGSILFLLLLCKEFGFNPFVFLALFLTVSIGIKDIGFFTHDAPMFFLSSLFALFYFKTLYKKQNCLFFLFVIAFASLWFRESGFIFVALAIVAALSKLRLPKRLPIKLPTVACAFFPLIDKTISDSVFALKEGFGFTKIVLPYGFMRFFQNTVFSMSFFFFLFNREKYHFVLLAVTFLYVYSVAVHTVYSDAVFRYTFSLVPLHLFYVLKGI